MQRDHYYVEGLANTNMKTQIRNALEKIEGVNGVCIDSARASVEVIYNSPAIAEEIQECIEKTGHNIL